MGFHAWELLLPGRKWRAWWGMTQLVGYAEVVGFFWLPDCSAEDLRDRASSAEPSRVPASSVRVNLLVPVWIHRIFLSRWSFLGTVHRPAHATVQASLQLKAFGRSTCLNSLACSKALRYVVLRACNRSSCLSLLPLQLPQMHGSWGVVVSRTSTFQDSKTSTPLHSKHCFLMPRCCWSKDEPLLMLDEELVQAEKGINLIL